MFVVDASFAAAWCFDDETTRLTDEYLVKAGETGVIVPALWCFEMANFLRTAEKRGRLTAAEADDRLQVLSAITILDEELSFKRIWGDTRAIARKHDLTVYDATYLELAIRLNLPLATRDKDMIKAAKTMGVATISH